MAYIITQFNIRVSATLHFTKHDAHAPSSVTECGKRINCESGVNRSLAIKDRQI